MISGIAAKLKSKASRKPVALQIRADNYKENWFDFTHGLVLHHQTILNQEIQTMLANFPAQIMDWDDSLSFEANSLALKFNRERFFVN